MPPDSLVHKCSHERSPQRAELWRQGPTLLGELEVPPSHRRPLIGRLLRRAEDDAELVLVTLRRALALGVMDPAAWLMSALGDKRQKPSNIDWMVREMREEAGPVAFTMDHVPWDHGP